MVSRKAPRHAGLVGSTIDALPWPDYDPSAMLETLGDIDWTRLGHAYGSAGDVPDQIRDLRASDPEVRKRARESLFGNIFHQGTRYEASAFAVPFLLELVRAGDTPERAEILWLLISLAIGYDETWLPEGIPIEALRPLANGGAELLAASPRPGEGASGKDHFRYRRSLSPAQLQRLEAHVSVAAYDAVRRGLSVVRELVSSEEREVRIAAACALGWFPEEANESLPVLREAEERAESDPAECVLAATALCLRRFAGRRASSGRTGAS